VKAVEAQGQLPEVSDDDDDTLKLVLLSASIASFCCLLVLSVSSILVTLSSRTTSSRKQRFSDNRKFQNSGSRRKVAIGVFVTLRAAYSLAFTFSGAMTACRIVARETGVDFVSGEDFVVATMTATSSPLFRRLAELERLGGLSSLDVEEDTLQRLRSSVTACGKYVDDLLYSTAVQIAQSSRLGQTSCALDRLQQVRRDFLVNAAEYVESKKTQLNAVVARPAVDEAKLRLNAMWDNNWLRYSRFLFASAAEMTSRNLSATNVERSAQFAAFLEADGELNAVEQWTAAINSR